jgi:hypothetical protein
MLSGFVEETRRTCGILSPTQRDAQDVNGIGKRLSEMQVDCFPSLRSSCEVNRAMDEFDRLPHWSRVAFAAECARRVQTLLTSAWPGASLSLLGDVERAIAMAEQSAVEGQARDSLKEAASAALRAAGRALIPHHYPVHLPTDDDENDPDTRGFTDRFVRRKSCRACREGRTGRVEQFGAASLEGGPICLRFDRGGRPP